MENNNSQNILNLLAEVTRSTTMPCLLWNMWFSTVGKSSLSSIVSPLGRKTGRGVGIQVYLGQERQGCSNMNVKTSRGVGILVYLGQERQGCSNMNVKTGKGVGILVYLGQERQGSSNMNVKTGRGVGIRVYLGQDRSDCR